MSEVRGRWRLVFGRDEEARFLSHLDAMRLWERAFRRGGIPVAASQGFNPRPKLIFASPLPLGMLAEHELADLFLTERLTAPELRDRLAAGMPRGYRVVDLYDVWVGAPAIAPQLVAADYRMTLFNVGRTRLEVAAARLMTAERLPRERRREGKAIAYDLRPLLLAAKVQAPDPMAIAAEMADVPAAGLWLRLRHSQELGSGRAEEVVAELAEDLGLTVSASSIEIGESETAGASGAAVRTASADASLEVVRPVRERLWLADELAV